MPKVSNLRSNYCPEPEPTQVSKEWTVSLFRIEIKPCRYKYQAARGEPLTAFLVILRQPLLMQQIDISDSGPDHSSEETGIPVHASIDRPKQCPASR